MYLHPLHSSSDLTLICVNRSLTTIINGNKTNRFSINEVYFIIFKVFHNTTPFLSGLPRRMSEYCKYSTTQKKQEWSKFNDAIRSSLGVGRLPPSPSLALLNPNAVSSWLTLQSDVANMEIKPTITPRPGSSESGRHRREQLPY